MSGSRFPLRTGEEGWSMLKTAAEAVEKVREMYWEDAYEGSSGQYDNSASDGGSLALLGLAVKLIRGEIRE
mgnify:CR=1 FL=1